MPVVVTAGARALLDSSRTDEESLGVCFGLFAELDDGRRIDVDPAAYKDDGPRRGAGALWGSITVDPSTLPSLDRTWFARDPLEAATHALEASFTLRPEHLEEFIRSELSDGPPARSGAAVSDGAEGSSIHSNVPWANLVVALRDAGVATTAATLRSMPFRMEFDANLLVELER